MIALVFLIVGFVFLFGLTYGIRNRQPLAIVAAFFVLATLYCAYGWLAAGMLSGNRFAATIWLALSAFSLVTAGVLAVLVWRSTGQNE